MCTHASAVGSRILQAACDTYLDRASYRACSLHEGYRYVCVGAMGCVWETGDVWHHGLFRMLYRYDMAWWFIQDILHIQCLFREIMVRCVREGNVRNCAGCVAKLAV